MVRAADATLAKNACDGSVPILIKNSDDYVSRYINMEAANTAGMFAAKFPGALGNSLKVSVFANTDYVARSSWNANKWTYAELFNGAPNTSTFAAQVGGSRDEMHVVVVDEDGKFTGTAGTVLESFAYLSKASDAITSEGSSNYYVNVINERSKYVYIINHAIDNDGLADTVTWGLPASGTTFTEGELSSTTGVYTK